MKQQIIDQFAKANLVRTREAAELVKTTIENDNIVYLVSADMHSNAVYEPFMKPGMLCALSPMTEPTLSNIISGSRAYYLRNTKNIGEFLCNYYRTLRQGDCIIIADHGNAIASAEIIEFALKNKIKTIHISPSLSQADICIHLKESSGPVGLHSTVLSLSIAALTSEIMLEAISLMESPDIWLPFSNQNTEANEKLLNKYRYKIKKL